MLEIDAKLSLKVGFHRASLPAIAHSTNQYIDLWNAELRHIWTCQLEFAPGIILQSFITPGQLSRRLTAIKCRARFELNKIIFNRLPEPAATSNTFAKTKK